MFDKSWFDQADGGRGFGRNGNCLILDQVWAQEYPALFAYLAQDKVGDEVREVATLRISVEVGQATVVLTDREYGRVAFYAAGSISGALAGMDAALAEGKLDWRVDRFAEPRKGRKSTRQRTASKPK